MLNELTVSLRDHGWATLAATEGVPSLAERVMNVAQSLGRVVRRHNGNAVACLSPRSKETARKASLSEKFGTGALPLHCDTAHWVTPCRFVVLACLEPGRINAPTLLLDTAQLELSAAELVLARSSCFLVRNGRQSFYANLIDNDRSFVRIDPGCMEPVTRAGGEAIALYSAIRNHKLVLPFHWLAGTILVIDNWRVLHGRGNEVEADSERILLRAYVQ